MIKLFYHTHTVFKMQANIQTCSDIRSKFFQNSRVELIDVDVAVAIFVLIYGRGGRCFENNRGELMLHALKTNCKYIEISDKYLKLNTPKLFFPNSKLFQTKIGLYRIQVKLYLKHLKA
jgi:hypothetical protein